MYHLPITYGFANLVIVHLETVNVVMALHLFARFDLVQEYWSNVTKMLL